MGYDAFDLKTILKNIASGYVLKVFQFIAGIIIIPYLISDSVFGLERYGYIAVLMVAPAFLTMLLDGWRLVIAREVGRSIKNDQTEKLSTYLLGSLLLALILACIAWLGVDRLIAFMEVDNVDAVVSILILLFINFVFEQIVYVFEAVIHAKGYTRNLNLLTGIQVISRTLLIYCLYQLIEATIFSYFLILAGFMLLHLSILSMGVKLIIKQPLLAGFSRKTFTQCLKESVGLTFRGSALFIVNRGTIVFANKYFSAELAAVLSIIIFVLRNYMFQFLVSSVRPMVMPLISQLDIKNDEVIGGKVSKIIGYYSVFAVIIVSLVAITSSIWVPLWLGSKFEEYSIYFTIGLLAAGLEVSAIYYAFALISQGKSLGLSLNSTLMGLLYLGGLTYFHYQEYFENMEYVLILVYLYALVEAAVIPSILFRHEFKQQSLSAYMSVVMVASIVFLLNVIQFKLNDPSDVMFIRNCSMVFVIICTIVYGYIYRLEIADLINKGRNLRGNRV